MHAWKNNKIETRWFNTVKISVRIHHGQYLMFQMKLLKGARMQSAGQCFSNIMCL
jgi:hypothetical protein